MNKMSEIRRREFLIVHLVQFFNFILATYPWSTSRQNDSLSHDPLI
jgi:hypothetical protein